MEKRSLREAIYEVRGDNRLQSCNSYASMSDRLIGSQLQNVALTFIKQRTDKRQLWSSPNIFSTLPCIELIKVNLSECGGYNVDPQISRSKYRLPKIAEGTHFGMLIRGVYSIDFPNPNNTSRRFIESTPDRFANSLGMNSKVKQIHFWIQDNYLYVSDPMVEHVKMIAFFEEDISQELLWYPSYCKDKIAKGCCSDSTQSTNIKDVTRCCPENPLDAEFRCPGYLYNDVIKAVITLLLGSYDKLSDVNKTTGLVK